MGGKYSEALGKPGKQIVGVHKSQSTCKSRIRCEEYIKDSDIKTFSMGKGGGLLSCL